MDHARILVVEDDAALRGVLLRGLREHGLTVTAVGDGAAALARFGDAPPHPFDAVVLDIGLPDADGRDVCQALRARGVTLPVLFLTARDQTGDLVSGFAAGGDDYIAKPFRFPELLARLDGLLRRATRPAPSPEPGMRLDPRTHSLTSAAGPVRLTPTEYRLLARLMGAPGQVVRRPELLAAGWPDGAIVHDNTLDQYLARLRRKLAAADPDRAITTVHGVGYEFR